MEFYAIKNKKSGRLFTNFQGNFYKQIFGFQDGKPPWIFRSKEDTKHVFGKKSEKMYEIVKVKIVEVEE